MISAVDAARYAIDEARIVSEVIDGEAVVINLENGYYYSLDPTATEVWEWIRAGRSLSEVVSALRARYDCSGADPDPAVRSVIAAWSADDLILPRAEPDHPPVGELPEAPAAPGRRPPFRAPGFERFTDMQGLLLVDPIHEVDERGWPNTPAGGPAPPGAR
jgi:hypothetical protein